MPWSLNAPAFAAKTVGPTRFFEQREESRPGLGLRRSDGPRSARYDRTSRNMSTRQHRSVAWTDRVGFHTTVIGLAGRRRQFSLSHRTEEPLRPPALRHHCWPFSFHKLKKNHSEKRTPMFAYKRF